MSLKIKQILLLLIYYLSPILVSIIYWFEEPELFSLESNTLLMNLIHRTGSILGIFSFIWMCFNVIIIIKLKLIEKKFSLNGILRFHTYMAAIALSFGIAHYPMVRLGRTYSSFQIRSGTIGFMIFATLMTLAFIFMSNRLIRYKRIEKLRIFAYKIKFKYKVNKILHNLMLLGISIIFIHTLIANTSTNSLLMSGIYIFFFTITIIGWINHKIIRIFRLNSDPYIYRKATWDAADSEILLKTNKKWAFTSIKRNPSLYTCLKCGICTENCPISKVTKGDYNPRRNILNALFGYKDVLLGEKDLVIWGCTSCNTCDEVCPQNIKLTETFEFLKNQSIALGKGPKFIISQSKMIFENAKAIPSQPAIKRRRDQLALPSIIQPDLGEIQTLLKNIEIDRKLQSIKL